MRKNSLVSLLLILTIAGIAIGQRIDFTQPTQYLKKVYINGSSTHVTDAVVNVRNEALGAVEGDITASSGTGITVNYNGFIGMRVYKVTVARTNFVAAAVTADVTLATLPAKTFVRRVIADVTTQFACTATCTSSTLSMTTGKTAGGNQYLVSYDVDAAAAVFGDALAEAGASLLAGTTPEVFVPELPSWTATTTVSARLTSGTGNIGTGTATNLSAGSVTFYILTERLP